MIDRSRARLSTALKPPQRQSITGAMTQETHARDRRPSLGDFAWAQGLLAERSAAGRATITGIVHTRNEEHNLPDALRSLAWVNRVLVVDMESEDQTVAIARAHGAEVVEVPNVGYVEPARNRALELADGDWVLVLDADERVPEPLARVLAEIAHDDLADVVELHWHNWIAGRFLGDSGWLGQYHPRFFRRGCVRWSDRIHEPPEVIGRVHRVPYTPDTALIHFNYDDLAHFVAKLNRYTDKEADALTGRPPMRWAELASHLRAEFVSRWTPGEDGPLSAALAFAMLFYRLIAQAKHWERLNFPAVELPSEGRAALRDLAHDGSTLHAAGLSAAEQGAGANAAELLRLSVLEQLNLEALNDYAVVCARVGRREEAQAVLRTCVSLAPAYQAARENLDALERGPDAGAAADAHP